jgi:hypothetical protein
LDEGRVGEEKERNRTINIRDIVRVVRCVHFAGWRASLRRLGKKYCSDTTLSRPLRAFPWHDQDVIPDRYDNSCAVRHTWRVAAALYHDARKANLAEVASTFLNGSPEERLHAAGAQSHRNLRRWSPRDRQKEGAPARAQARSVYCTGCHATLPLLVLGQVSNIVNINGGKI